MLAKLTLRVRVGVLTCFEIEKNRLVSLQMKKTKLHFVKMEVTNMLTKKSVKKSATKPAAKKAGAKKAAPKKTAAKKKPAAKKKVAAKKTAVKKTAAKKPAAKKAAAKKAVKKTAAKKAVKKTAAKKTAAKKPAAKKAVKKAGVKKAAPKKAAAKKTARKPSVRRAKAAPAAAPAASEGGEPSEPDGESGLLSSPYSAPKISGHVNGEEFNAALLKGKWKVLYFYPKDMTPGCTVEARDFQALSREYQQQEAVVIGVSKDSCQSHSKFAQKEGLSFMLISDEESDLCERFGVWKEKSMYGKTYMGIERSTFLISPEGQVVARWPKVKVAGHAHEVLSALKKAQS
jgi:peroxiredoxin Q/BCP